MVNKYGAVGAVRADEIKRSVWSKRSRLKSVHQNQHNIYHWIEDGLPPKLWHGLFFIDD
jgi:hypothetical protein